MRITPQGVLVNREDAQSRDVPSAVDPCPPSRCRVPAGGPQALTASPAVPRCTRPGPGLAQARKLRNC